MNTPQVPPYGQRVHDLGGRSAGRCDLDEHDYEIWEKRVDALMMLLWHRTKSISVDELRRNIEELGREAYDEMGYYERWMHAITQTLVQRGVIKLEALGAKMAEIEARGNE